MRERLKDIEIDAIYSSNVKRAVQTAEIVNSFGLDIKFDERLAERDPGSFIGKKRSEIDKNLWNSLTIERTDEGAETLKAGLIRTKSILEEIKELNKDKKVLIVTHNFICKCIWMLMEEVTDMDEINSFMQKNDEIRRYVKKI